MKVGFIGLGNVGGKLAGSLIRNSHDVTVLDLNKELVQQFAERGASASETPEQMMRDCESAITCLPSPAASAAVLEGENGLLNAVEPGKIWMEMSTMDEAEAKRLGTKVIAKGGAAVDCPVSGGCHRWIRLV